MGKNYSIRKLIIDPDCGVIDFDAAMDGVVASIENKCDVDVIHNDRCFPIVYEDIKRMVLSAMKTPAKVKG